MAIIRRKFQKYIHLLKLLKQNCKKNCGEKFKNIISYLDEETLCFLAECVRNSIAPEFIKRLTKNKRRAIINKVSPHKKIVKTVISKNLPFKKRKKLLQEGGAWFLPLVSTLLPIITSLISNS